MPTRAPLQPDVAPLVGHDRACAPEIADLLHHRSRNDAGYVRVVEQQVSEPTEQDIERLARQVLVVDELAVTHLGRGLANDDSDLDLLQALLDGRALEPTQTYELQCLGVVFGRLLVDALGGVDWAVVEDEHGRDPALRYLQSSLIIFPLTMISKRVEARESVDVRKLFGRICAEIDRLRAELGPN